MTTKEVRLINLYDLVILKSSKCVDHYFHECLERKIRKTKVVFLFLKLFVLTFITLNASILLNQQLLSIAAMFNAAT